jgi:hypothetical protein
MRLLIGACAIFMCNIATSNYTFSQSAQPLTPATSRVIKDFESKGFSVTVPSVSSRTISPRAISNSTVATPVAVPLIVRNSTSPVQGNFGLVYGKVRVTLGSAVSSSGQAQKAMQDWISQLAGTTNTTYSVTLTIQKAGTDVLKAVLATNTRGQTNLLGLSIADQYTAASTTGGIVLRGLVVRQDTNDLAAKLEVVRSEKITFNAEAAGKAADAYNKLSIQHLVPIATSLSPQVAAVSQLVSLFLPSSSGSNEALTVPLQFIPNDRLDAKHVFTKGDPITTVSLELDDTIFRSSFDRATKKFSNPNPDLMWTEAIFSPTLKHAKDLLRDDLPTADPSSKIVKKFIADLEGNTLAPFSKLEKAQQDTIGLTCEAVHTALSSYFTVPDAAAVLWIVFYRYSTTLKQNGEYMNRCLTDKIKTAFTKYGLPIDILQ